MGIFFLSSETSYQNLAKLDMKQDLNVFYELCAFRANQKSKMASLSSD